jgi:N-acetylornithine carbamoyltransferase
VRSQSNQVDSSGVNSLVPLAALKGRSFLSTSDLSPSELLSLIDLTIAGKKAGNSGFGAPLAGRGVGLVFFNPSLRTRASMTMAVAQLGGQPVPLEIGAGTWDLEHRTGIIMDGNKSEHVREAVPVLSQYVDGIGVRCFPAQKSLAEDRLDPILTAFAEHAQVPVINLESSMYHPCQALADMVTIREHLGGFTGRKITLIWANHPKALPHAVPNSFALAALQCGADLTIAAPAEYLPDDEFSNRLAQTASLSGASLRLTTDQDAAYDGAQVIYAKSWASTKYYGDAQRDLACRANYRHWQVTSELMQNTNDGIFMHCLPVRRNVVVADSVLDGPRSVVIQQAANRLAAQKALLASIFS